MDFFYIVRSQYKNPTFFYHIFHFFFKFFFYENECEVFKYLKRRNNITIIDVGSSDLCFSAYISKFFYKSNFFPKLHIYYYSKNNFEKQLAMENLFSCPLFLCPIEEVYRFNINNTKKIAELFFNFISFSFFIWARTAVSSSFSVSKERAKSFCVLNKPLSKNA